MKNLFLLFTIIITTMISVTFSPLDNPNSNTAGEQPTIYYFIRHAEKDTSNPTDKDPEINGQGKMRAGNWAKVFKEIDFDVIYSSNYKRTRTTAKIIADTRGKEIKLYDASKLNDEDFKLNTRGKTVLVVGHSNSNPAFINFILEENKFKDIPETEYGSLHIISIFPNGKKLSQVLYIN
ncbi:hypothetical protein BH23BAC2_BH23BAC2_11780 [soil metagenome]